MRFVNCRRSLLLSLVLLSSQTKVSSFSGHPPRRRLRRSLRFQGSNEEVELTTGNISPFSKSSPSLILASSTMQRNKKSKKTVTRSPLVDSDLLRFLSLQKDELKQRNRSAGVSCDTTVDLQNGFALHRLTCDDPSAAPSLSFLTNTRPDLTLSSQVPSQSTSAFFEPSWLAQYNSLHVSSILHSLDESVDESLTLLAGRRVQDEAHSRNTRRRVRTFLRERDQIWKLSTLLDKSDDTISSFVLRANNLTSSSPKSYKFQDTVELMMTSSIEHPYGLTVRDVCEILVHTPSVALMQPRTSYSDDRMSSDGGECLQETLDRVMRLLTGILHLRKYDARRVLRTCPGLLTKRGSRDAELTIKLFTNSLSVSANSIARDKVGLPALLSRTPSSLFRLVSFLASDAVRMPVSQIGPLLRQTKSSKLLDTIAPVMPCSMKPSRSHFAEESSCNEHHVNSNAALHPTPRQKVLFQVRRECINAAYRDMSATAWTLRNEVGTSDLGKVIAAYPSVLLLDADRQILPVANFLMNNLGIWKDDLARVLQLYPTLLGLNIDEIENVVEYLKTKLDVDPENLSIIFRSFPSLLTLNMNDMEHVVDFLRRQIGIANVGRFVSRLPPVLSYSVERELLPKWEFLMSAYNDARFEVTRFPAYFSYPLERVIKTRFEYLRNVKRIPIHLVALDQVLRYGDKDFSVKVARDTDRGAAFSAFTKKRVTDSIRSIASSSTSRAATNRAT